MVENPWNPPSAILLHAKYYGSSKVVRSVPVPNIFCRLMFVVWFSVYASIPVVAQTTVSCPTDIPTNATLSPTGTAQTFAPNANLTIYIDTTSYPPAANNTNALPNNMNTALTIMANAWAAYQTSRGGSAQVIAEPFSQIPAIPARPNPANPVQIFTQTPVQINNEIPTIPSGYDAETTWDADPGTGFSYASETTFTPSYILGITDMPSVMGAAGLASHEIAQPFGFGDCRGSSDCALSVANDVGNTIIALTPCDQLMVQKIVSSIRAAHTGTAVLVPGTGTGSGLGSSVDIGPLTFSFNYGMSNTVTGVPWIESITEVGTNAIGEPFQSVTDYNLDGTSTTHGSMQVNGSTTTYTTNTFIDGTSETIGTTINADRSINSYVIYNDGTTINHSSVTQNADGVIISVEEDVYRSDGSSTVAYTIYNADGSSTTTTYITDSNGNTTSSTSTSSSGSTGSGGTAGTGSSGSTGSGSTGDTSSSDGSSTGVFLLNATITTTDISDNGGSSGCIYTQTTYYYSDGSSVYETPSTECYSSCSW